MSWRGWRRRVRADAELQEEMKFHLAAEIDENIARGVSPEEARRLALLKFGNPQQVRDKLWRQNTVSWLDGLGRNLRHGGRALRRAPGFAFVSIVVIALGIGVNAALFTVVRGVLLKPLPFRDSQSLVRLYEDTLDHKFPFNDSAAGIFAEWQRQSRSFAGMALGSDAAYALSGTPGQIPETVHAATFSASMLPLLGVEPVLGRNFSAADDSPAADGTVLLSWTLWKRRFGGNPSILGQTILLNARPYAVVGVMPSWFVYPASTVQLWTPAYHERSFAEMQMLDEHNFQAVGRLKPGVSLHEAATDLSLITLRIHDAHRDDPFVSSGANARFLLDSMVGDARTPLLILLGATGCVLLIACLNISNLMMTRSVGRRRELAIRSALGGSRVELLRQHLTESLLLSAIGGGLGLCLAFPLVQWFGQLRQDLPRIQAIQIDGVVVAFTAGLVVLSALFAGFVSAFPAGGDSLLSALQESSRSATAGQGRTRLRRAMLAAEVGLTVVLLIGAGLLLKSYARLRSTDLGCLTDNLLTMDFSLPAARYDFPTAVHFYQELLTRVRTYPGVRSAGLVTTLPGAGYGGDGGFLIQGRPRLPNGKGQLALQRWVDPGYFAAIGIPLERGRTFGDNQQLATASEVIISVALQQQYFPFEDPIGKTVLTGGVRPYRIVGVVGDTRFSVGERARPMMYFPIYALMSKVPTDFVAGAALAVRSEDDVTGFALPIQKVFLQLDPDLPVSDILTMDQVIAGQTVDASFDAGLLLVFALVSLLLATVGLFGVISYLAAQRTAEIGVRIALGAQPGQVVILMLRDGLQSAVVGLLLGLGTSIGLTRTIQSMLYETQPLDVEVFSIVAVTLLVVAAAACLVPAWRSARLDPLTALRMQ